MRTTRTASTKPQINGLDCHPNIIDYADTPVFTLDVDTGLVVRQDVLGFLHGIDGKPDMLHGRPINKKIIECFSMKFKSRDNLKMFLDANYIILYMLDYYEGSQEYTLRFTYVNDIVFPQMMLDKLNKLGL